MTQQEMHDLAVELAREAGDYAREYLEHADNDIQAKGDGADVVTRVDVHCEQRMIQRIQAECPGHAITGEEHGDLGEADAPYRWMLDPLDGTNNFVMGLPLFGVCITVLEDGLPIIAVVHDSVRGITTSAIRGQGAWRDGERLQMRAPVEPARTTISWTQGYEVTLDDPFTTRVWPQVERRYKRILSTWAPSIDWGLIAAGQVGAFVSWKNTLHDTVGGMLIVEEAGGENWMADDVYELVVSGYPEVVAALRTVIEEAGFRGR